MKITQVIRLLLRNWYVVAIITVLVTAGAFGVSKTRMPLYSSTAVEYVGLTGGASTAELAQGSNYIQDQMASFGALAASPLVLNKVIDDLSLQTTAKDLSRAISVTTPRNTVILQIAVTDSSPQGAAQIANAVGARLADAVDEVAPKRPNGKSAVAVRQIQSAVPPVFQSSPNTKRNTAGGLLIGLILGCAAVILRYRYDSSVRTPSVLAQVTTRKLLGTIRHAANLQQRALVVQSDPNSDSAEDVRRVRASIEHLAGTRPSFALAVTSSVRAEGRSTVAANLAASLAEAGRRTVLIDADLRSPGQAGITGTDGSIGLVGALDGAIDLSNALQPASGGFSVLNAGGRYDNPTELFASQALGSLVASLRQQFEFVIVDTPPVLAVSDAAAMHRHIDGAVFLVHGKRVNRDQLESALRTADLAGLRTLGIIMNDVRPESVASTGGYPEAGHGATSPQQIAAYDASSDERDAAA